MTTVSYSTADQVMHVLLDGADTMNSLSPQTLAGLDAAIEAAEADLSLRAVVITGAGERAFSVGMDITFLGECFDDPEGTFGPFIDDYHRVLRRLEALPVPVIARVAGLARAGGFELILACDFVIAADEAKVGDIHLQFGMPPGAGASQRAPRKLGDQRARALMLTTLWLDGPAMVEWGLALTSVPRDQLDAEIERFVGGLRGRSRAAIAITKAAINATHELTLEQGLRYERELFGRLHDHTPDAREGYQAFVDGREPSWGDADVSPLA